MIIFSSIFGPSWGPLGVLLGASWGPKRDPRSAKIGPEIDPNFKNEKKAFGYRLGSILDPSRGVLGASWGAPGGQKVWFRTVKRGSFEERRFGAKKASETLLGAKLRPLGRPRGPKGAPKGRPRGAQEAPKRKKKSSEFVLFLRWIWKISVAEGWRDQVTAGAGRRHWAPPLKDSSTLVERILNDHEPTNLTL